MNMHKWTQTMLGGETAVEAFMAALEAIFVSIVGRVAVWFTPLPSAVLVARSATRVFELDGIWPWIMAGVIELVGLVICTPILSKFTVDLRYSYPNYGKMEGVTGRGD